MKKLIVTYALVFALFAWVFYPSGTAQETATSPIEFALADLDGRADYKIWGELQWENSYGTSVRTVQFSGDSLNATLGYEDERFWIISMDSVRAGTADSTIMLVTVSGIARRGKPAPFTPYKDSLFYHPEIEVVNEHFFPGVHITMEDSAGAPDVAVGDTVKMAYWRRSLDKLWARTLRIYPPTAGQEDTILVGGAPVALKVVSNRYEHLTLKYQNTTTSSDTTVQVDWGYMLKNNGDPRWGGPGSDAVALHDSTFKISSGATGLRAMPNWLSVTHTNSDSIKIIGYIGSGATGRQIFQWTEIIQHNN